MTIQYWWYGTFRTGSLRPIWNGFQNWYFEVAMWLTGAFSIIDWLRAPYSQHQFENLPGVDDIFSGMYDVIRRCVWYWSVFFVSGPVVKYRIKDSIGSSENSIFPELFQIWVFIECLKRWFKTWLTIVGNKICRWQLFGIGDDLSASVILWGN